MEGVLCGRRPKRGMAHPKHGDSVAAVDSCLSSVTKHFLNLDKTGTLHGELCPVCMATRLSKTDRQETRGSVYGKREGKVNKIEKALLKLVKDRRKTRTSAPEIGRACHIAFTPSCE